MKVKYLRLCILPLAAAGLMLASGCVVEPGRVGFAVVAPAPVVVAPVPPPPPPAVVVAPVYVPDYYVWDGFEYVGFVGETSFYLGPGNVWIVCDPVRVERFHGWERYHADWRVHAIRNDHFRTDRYGHVEPRHDEPRRQVEHGPERKRDEHEHEH
jgi:hypothetical protein